jgi:hypothetical protein
VNNKVMNNLETVFLYTHVENSLFIFLPHLLATINFCGLSLPGLNDIKIAGSPYTLLAFRRPGCLLETL